eukprot:scaffold30870_cov36-Tisochrysis_lutea.AAC.2
MSIFVSDDPCATVETSIPDTATAASSAALLRWSERDILLTRASLRACTASRLCLRASLSLRVASASILSARGCRLPRRRPAAPGTSRASHQPMWSVVIPPSPSPSSLS